MKLQRLSTAIIALFLMLGLAFSANNSFAQTKMKHSAMKDCCMMKDGKMMCMKDGKEMAMDKDMTMANGTKCMTNGVCIMKNGKKMTMKNGQCMDMSGKMSKCPMGDMKMKKDQM